MSFISPKDAGRYFPGLETVPWQPEQELGSPINVCDVCHYHVTARRFDLNDWRVSAATSYLARSIGGAVAEQRVALFHANLKPAVDNEGTEGFEVVDAHDFRGANTVAIMPYKAFALFKHAELAAPKLRSALERVGQLAGLSRARGEEPLLSDYMTARPAAGVIESEAHLAEMHEVRNFALAQLEFLLPTATVDRLRGLAATPVRPGAGFLRTDDPKVVIFKPRGS